MDQLQKVGNPQHKFIFVADYSELRGYTATEAIYKSGGTLRHGARVTAIIFPVDRRDLFPASARGVLQVVRKIDKELGSTAKYVPARLDSNHF